MHNCRGIGMFRKSSVPFFFFNYLCEFCNFCLSVALYACLLYSSVGSNFENTLLHAFWSRFYNVVCYSCTVSGYSFFATLFAFAYNL